MTPHFEYSRTNKMWCDIYCRQVEKLNYLGIVVDLILKAGCCQGSPGVRRPETC